MQVRGLPSHPEAPGWSWRWGRLAGGLEECAGGHPSAELETEMSGATVAVRGSAPPARELLGLQILGVCLSVFIYLHTPA